MHSEVSSAWESFCQAAPEDAGEFAWGNRSWYKIRRSKRPTPRATVGVLWTGHSRSWPQKEETESRERWVDPSMDHFFLMGLTNTYRDNWNEAGRAVEVTGWEEVLPGLDALDPRLVIEYANINPSEWLYQHQKEWLPFCQMLPKAAFDAWNGWALWWYVVRRYEVAHNVRYQVFMRLRPDTVFYPAMDTILHHLPMHPNVVWLQTDRFAIVPRFSAGRYFEFPRNVFDGTCHRHVGFRAEGTRSKFCRPALGLARYYSNCLIFVAPYHTGVSMYNLPLWCGFKQTRPNSDPHLRAKFELREEECDVLQMLRTPCAIPNPFASRCLGFVWQNAQTPEYLLALNWTLPRVYADPGGFERLARQTVVVPRPSMDRSAL